MTHKPGTRIAAIRDANDTTINLYGRGVYAGDHPRPGSGNWSQRDREIAEDAVRSSLENADELRAADDAFMVRRLDEAVAEGAKTREEADQALAEYREIRAAREARWASTSVEEQAVDLLQQMGLNPRMDLDGGGTVWGCECWWMPEEQFEKFTCGREVVLVPLPKRDGGAR